MRHVSTVLGALAAAFVLTAAPTARADRLDPPRITLAKKGNDLEVVVHNVTDYCVTNADTRIVRAGDAIRILRDRPSRVSRCLGTRDLTFVVPDVGAGRYTVTYERLPLIAPIRWMQVASTTAIVE
jgi:hypothetical protein